MNDLDFVLKALGTQLKPIIEVVSKQPLATQPTSYATAITTLARMAGLEQNKSAKLGIAVALARMGAHKASVDQAARQVGAL